MVFSMASCCVKSLQSKSRAADDVVHHRPLLASTSCRFETLMDVVESAKKKPKRKPLKRPPTLSPPLEIPEPMSLIPSSFPALNELPEGHPSRNVVEIIFRTRWSTKPFLGRVDMVFKVQNMAQTMTQFEEYREVVKSFAGFKNTNLEGDYTRCLADGNEVMGFYCLSPAAHGSVYECGGGPWPFHSGKGTVVCTFACSAHHNVSGGRGLGAMLLCRVIAGRVCKPVGVDSEGRGGFNSVSMEKGELLVFDARALLPCFLIIYEV